MSRPRVGWIPDNVIVSRNDGPNGSVLHANVILSLQWTPGSCSGRDVVMREAATAMGDGVNS
jgi:hypothetical protein